MSKTPHPNLLLVEGPDDMHSITNLMQRHVSWPADCHKQTPPQCPILIESFNGISKLTSPFLSVKWKTENLQTMGIVIDADDRPLDRFRAVRNHAASFLPNLPKEPVRGGLVVSTDDGKRFGIWMMPDNSASGMLETFLSHCIDEARKPMWSYVNSILDSALELCVEGSRPHREKAAIHTFLAWQEPPGNPFGLAIKARAFDTNMPLARQFADWCIHLFGLQTTTALSDK